MHDAPAVGGADEPPCHDAAGEENDPAVAAVGDGIVRLDGDLLIGRNGVTMW